MRITFGSDFTTSDGTQHKGGDTADVPDPEARSILARGKARRVEEPESLPITTHNGEIVRVNPSVLALSEDQLAALAAEPDQAALAETKAPSGARKGPKS